MSTEQIAKLEQLSLELGDGQIQFTMNQPVFEKFTLETAGFQEESYKTKGGNVRIQINLGAIQNVNFYKMPVIELNYAGKIHESGWIVEFNGTNILEKTDHSGQATILLLNRNKMTDLVQRHENTILIHGDFSEEVELQKDSSFQILEEPGQ